MTTLVKKLPIWQTLGEAWRKVKGTKRTFAAAIVLLLLIEMGLGSIEFIFKLTLSSFYINSLFLGIIYVLLILINNIIACLIRSGLLYIGIQRTFNQPIRYTQLFHTFQFHLAWKLIVFFIFEMLYFVALLGFLVNISLSFPELLFWTLGYLTALYFSVRLSLGVGFVLDQKVGLWQAIKMSFQATQSNFFRLVLISLIKHSFLILSLIPLGLGLIWSLPFSIILYGTIYKTLRQTHQTESIQ